MRRGLLRSMGGEKEYEFVYALNNVISSNTTPTRIRRISDDAESDIGYDGTVVDASAITTFASGGEARFVQLYDQTGNLPPIATMGDLSKQPLATDGTFNGLTFAKDGTQPEGFVNVESLNIDFRQDIIAHYIFRNELNNNSQRFNLMVTTDQMDGGIFGLGLRGSVSNYIIGFTIQDGLEYTSQSSQRRAVIPKGDTTTNFTLYTFVKIGGVYNFYRNGVIQVIDDTAETIGNPLASVVEDNRYGIAIGTGSSNAFISGSGKINDFKGALLKAGDLSGFDLSANMTDVMTKFGI